MNIQYVGEDNRIHSLGDSNALQHWKYVKKIQTSSGPRYFYSMDELRAYYNDAKKYLSPEGFQNRARKDWDNEIKRHESNINPLHRRRLDMMNKDGGYESLSRRTDFRSNEKAIVSENRRHSEERSKISKRIKRADKYKEISDDIKDRVKYAKPQSPSSMSKKYHQDVDKEWDRYHNAIEKSNDFKSFSKNERKHEKRKTQLADRRYNINRYKSATKKVSDIKNSGTKQINKGRSAVEKKLNKAKKTTKSEVKGVKRATNAIRNKGNNYYDAHDTAPKSYSTYDRKKKKFGKNNKTGRIERTMIAAYRKTHPYE